MNLRPLGVVKEIVESVGMGISHAYDDLVFLEHNAFLIQFVDNSNVLLLHVNSESDQDRIKADTPKLRKAAELHGMELHLGTHYTIAQADNDMLRIEFSDNC